MHAKFRRRSPTQQHLLRKRQPAPQDVGGSSSDSDDVSGLESLTLTGPITFTITQTTDDTSTSVSASDIPTSTTTVTATSTQLPSSTSSTFESSVSSSSSSASSSQSSVLSSSTTSSSALATQPSASAIATGASNGNNPSEQSNGQTATRSLPTGAVVGIIIGSLILLVLAAVIGMRRRSMRSRLRMRAWANAPSVAVGPPVGSWQTEKFPPDSPPAAPQTSSVSSGETSPGIQFAQPQKRVLVPAAPPMSYGNDVGHVSITVPTAAAGAMPVLSPNYEVNLAPFSSVVQCTFVPRLPDEMSIAIGERIRVLAEYDDGWALCMNGRGEQGMVPIECLDHPSSASLAAQENRDAGSFRRVSSLQPSTKGSSGH